MTQPRRQLVDATQAQFFHLINRCVRRSWLCGRDQYSGGTFEHRKVWLSARILELGDIFATGIYAFAVMSNHVHVVLHMSPATANAWSDEEVARRWVRLFPASTPELGAQKVADQMFGSRVTSFDFVPPQVNEVLKRTHCAQSKRRG